MAKFKLLKPRVRNMRSRVPVLKIDDDLILNPLTLERKALYRTKRWEELRKSRMDKMCWGKCGRYAVVLDHLLGHTDDQAMTVSRQIGIPANPDWQVRFWEGPFVSLCLECHNRKTWHENRGRLAEWIKNRKRPNPSA